ncbi:hypothetical protein GALL_35570 [mine drainage metagenome]|uniref:Uncharacterized protein n=1 Tax=mine drainage metagenome TaxID=410659 RepID=A0A1J5TIB6_9ZZZZ
MLEFLFCRSRNHRVQTRPRRIRSTSTCALPIANHPAGSGIHVKYSRLHIAPVNHIDDFVYCVLLEIKIDQWAGMTFHLRCSFLWRTTFNLGFHQSRSDRVIAAITKALRHYKARGLKRPRTPYSKLSGVLHAASINWRAIVTGSGNAGNALRGNQPAASISDGSGLMVPPA